MFDSRLKAFTLYMRYVKFLASIFDVSQYSSFHLDHFLSTAIFVFIRVVAYHSVSSRSVCYCLRFSLLDNKHVHVLCYIK